MRDRRGDGDALGAHLHAVLRVAARGDAARLHDLAQAHLLVHLPRGMRVEQAHLLDGGRPHEVGLGVDVRARLQTAAAGHALGQLVGPPARVLRHARARPQVEGTVDVDPRMHSLERVEQLLAIHHEVAHDGKRAERRQANGLLKLVDQRRARLPGLAVDQHRAASAHLFEAHALPHHRLDLLALGVDGVLADLHQGAGHVHVRAIRDGELLDIGPRIGARLTLDGKAHHALGCHHASFFVLV